VIRLAQARKIKAACRQKARSPAAAPTITTSRQPAGQWSWHHPRRRDAALCRSNWSIRMSCHIRAMLGTPTIPSEPPVPEFSLRNALRSTSWHRPALTPHSTNKRRNTHASMNILKHLGGDNPLCCGLNYTIRPHTREDSAKRAQYRPKWLHWYEKACRAWTLWCSDTAHGHHVRPR